MRFALINIIIFPILLAGMILLQIFLSKRESKWPGLAIPCICLILALILSLGQVAWMSPGETTMQVYEDGQLIESQVTGPPTERVIGAQEVLLLFITFLLFNIPTIINLAIYFACRKNFKKKRELDRMAIQDL